MGVALLTDEQIRAIVEEAVERGAAKALERARPAGTELTSEQACAELGIARRTLRKWVKLGKITPSRRHGREFRFRPSDVEAAKGGVQASAVAKTLRSLGMG